MEDNRSSNCFVATLTRCCSKRKSKSKKALKNVNGDEIPLKENKGDRLHTDALIFQGNAFNIPKENIEVDDNDEDLYYAMSNEKKSIAVIFNHYKFDCNNGVQLNKRIGTKEDAKNVENVLNSLGFETTVYNDLTFQDIRTKIKEVSSMSSSEINCVTVVVMSHGSKDGIVYASNGPYLTSELFDPFVSESTKLVGVPKLFFLQACRGDLMDSGVEVDGPSSSTAANRLLPTHADILIMYSTMKDHLSWREATGSWFIKELCAVLSNFAYVNKWDLLQLLTIVNRRVAVNYMSNTYIEDNPLSIITNHKKQMPQIEFTLTKFLKFTNIPVINGNKQ